MCFVCFPFHLQMVKGGDFINLTTLLSHLIQVLQIVPLHLQRVQAAEIETSVVLPLTAGNTVWGLGQEYWRKSIFCGCDDVEKQ